MIKQDWIEQIGKMINKGNVCPLYDDDECPNGTANCEKCFKIFLENLKEGGENE